MPAVRPTTEDVRAALRYDPETGVFTWTASRGRVEAGARAGCQDGQGYVAIGFNGRAYRAHVLAWLYVTGEWPTSLIDHRNTIRSDNRFSNLRMTDTSINGQNRSSADRDSVSGLLGVSPSRGKWKASIGVAGRTRMLGRFANPEAAARAYQSAKRQLHPGYTPDTQALLPNL